MVFVVFQHLGCSVRRFHGLGFAVLLGGFAVLAACGGDGVPENGASPSVASTPTTGETETTTALELLEHVVEASPGPAKPEEQGSEPPQGVVVEEIGVGSALEKAGLQVGDVVLSWRRLPNPPANPQEAKGDLRSPFDWMWMEIEQAPRGTLELAVQRGGKEQVVVVEPGYWDGRVRPFLSGEMLADYERGLEEVAAEDLEGAERWWGRLAEQSLREKDRAAQAWLYYRLGQGRAEPMQLEESLRWLALALESAPDRISRIVILKYRGLIFLNKTNVEKAGRDFSVALTSSREAEPDNLLSASLLDRQALWADTSGDLERSMDYLRDALRIREALAPGSIALADSMTLIASLKIKLGDLEGAETLLHNALKIHEKLAPGNQLMADTLDTIGAVAFHRGQLNLSEEYFKRCLEIYRKQDPNGFSVASTLNNLGAVHWRRGDLDLAEEAFLQALHVFERRGGPWTISAVLSNIGLIALERGDLENAGVYFQESLSIHHKDSTQNKFTVSSLVNLGNVLLARGELETSSRVLGDALALAESISLESLELATILNNLGDLALRRGDLALARRYSLHALRIQEEQSGESLHTAASLDLLGASALEEGKLRLARTYLGRALDIYEDLAPRSLQAAATLRNLAAVSLASSEFELARSYLGEAVSIQTETAPHSLAVAVSLYELGRTLIKDGDIEGALTQWRRAIDAIESQVTRLGGSQIARASFLADHANFYDDLVETLVELHRYEEAFHVLERSRAQSFLALLAERHLLFEADLPEELARRRERLLVRHDRAYQELMESAQATPEERETLQGQLADIQRELDGIREEIRRTFPRFAALQYPRPLDLEGARQALDPGTVLLSYSVGDEQVILFVVRPEGRFTVKTLSLGEEELRDEVALMRNLIAEGRPGSGVGSFRGDHLQQVSRRLYNALIAPVADELEGAERLLILPDSALHTLPWAALVREIPETQETERTRREQGRDWQYLIEWKPFHVALSATVYAELRETRHQQVREGQPPVLQAAFGDPEIPERFRREDAEAIEDVRVRAAAERGFDFRPLPATRLEVEGIARLFGDSARAFVGTEATEERAKSVGAEARYLHFATHGHLDERFPLNSALVLSIPETFREDRDNGLLQVWEIFERVRFDADLVVLSACESALGEELGGEGLIGLTRAFQYAGARSVVASLWQVADASTAELMLRFYRHLQAVQTKDEALRAAQLELIRGPILIGPEGAREETDASASYAWAAFQLYGDWQ